MLKRNMSGYLAKVEAEINTAWKKLPIFRGDRPSALLKVITACDDRIRILRMSGAPAAMQFSEALRFGQDALHYAIPWVFQSCLATKSPIPEVVTEANYKQGMELADYADGYDSAVIAFTNYHQGRFRAFVAKKDPRITFTYASAEVEEAERVKRAYEMYELETEHPDALSGEYVKVFESLRNATANRAIRDNRDRVRLKLDPELISLLRSVRDVEIALHPAEIEDAQSFSGVPYRSFRSYYGALASLCAAHEFLHLSPAVREIPGGALSSLCFRLKVDELNSYIADISQLKPDEVSLISKLFTFDGSIHNLHPICQPLILANQTEVLVPRAFSGGSRFERNFQKLLAKNPLTRREFDTFSSSKENIALPRLVTLLRQQGIAATDRVPISEGGRLVTDIDILAFDRRDGSLLVLQHKWLIEPDTVNESKACDEKLSKGVSQARTAISYLENTAFARQILPDIPPEGYSSLQGLVVSKGFEPTGFLPETDIPVVTEEWFKANVRTCSGLGALHGLARSRPDRRELAKKFMSSSAVARLAGYELRVPVIAQVIEGSGAH